MSTQSYVVLVGMMGSGKSTVGKLLAESLGVPFEDTDQMLHHRLGRPVSELFSLYGEPTFRQHETALLKSLSPKPGVLATGGGIVLRDENWEEMQRLGRTVFLDVSEEKMIERLAVSRRKRPLLADDDWREKYHTLLTTRRPLYEKADKQVRVINEEFGEVVAMVKRELEL